MRAASIFFVCLLSLVLAAAIPGGVVIEGRVSDDIRPGSSSPATIRIHKGGLDYFGRLLMVIPEGLSISPKTLHGGSFRWDPKSRTAVVSWLKLPPEDRFDVEFDFAASESCFPGSNPIQWEFSFIRNNARETVKPTPWIIEVRPGDDGLLQDATTMDAGASSTPEASHNVTAFRQTEWMNDDLKVTITVAGMSPGSFARIEETLTADCEMTDLETQGATVERQEGTLEFLWFDSPGQVQVSYTLLACALSPPKNLSGTLSFATGDNSFRLPILSFESNETDRPIKELREPDAHIHFGVQLAATKMPVVTDYFKRRLNFALEPLEEKESDWYKYSHGSFDQYREARDYREKLHADHAFIGPFVVSWRGEQRISVQEALIRTGQSWLP